MTKKTKKSIRRTQNRDETHIEKFAEIFKMLYASITGLLQRIWRRVRRTADKSKENGIESPRPAYILGCAPTSASDIVAVYDRSEYANMHVSPTSGVINSNNSVWPIWTDAEGDTYLNNPLAASVMGSDGWRRNSRHH